MNFGENKLNPLQMVDARESAYQASENQRGVEDRIKQASSDFAEAERIYRKALANKILDLRADGVAVTAASDIARGETNVANKRYDRDVKEGVLEATKQEAFRRGADRADVRQLIQWSMHRDIRTDSPPADWEQQPTYGRGQ